MAFNPSSVFSGPEIHGSFSASGGGGTFAAVFLLLSLFYVLYFGFAIACYILQSLGMYRIAKRRGLRLYGMAWVPVGNIWLLGSIADQYNRKVKGKNSHYGVWMLVLALVVFVFAWVGGILLSVTAIFTRHGAELSGSMFGVAVAAMILLFLTAALAIVLAVQEYISYHKLYASSRPKQATLFTVLSVLFAVTIPFFVFACGNRDDGMPGPVDSTVEPTAAEPEPKAEPETPPALEAPAEPDSEPAEPTEPAPEEETP